MSDPAPYAAVIETHSAMLFFVGERVYKAKKPVDLGFLDFRGLESRKEACEREVSLNARLSPDVYHGVAALHGPDGEICEHLVVMDRMPEDRRLSRRLDAGEDVRVALTDVARQLAHLHAASTPAGEMGRVATRDALQRLWQDGFDVMDRHLSDEALGESVRTLLDPETQSRIELLVARYLDGREPLFTDRIESGQVRDGHGDLQAEDIFCLDVGPRVLDCLEFDDALRWGDVLADVAFLTMDLERLGHPELAAHFVEQYRQRSGATWPSSLAHLYIAYRAHVRAKVGLIRALQTGEQPIAVEDHQQLALRHLEAGRVRLILVGGLPGTGKSTVGMALAARSGAEIVRSDELREDIPPEHRFDAASIALVYDRMLARATALLERGHHVVLDATWSEAARRSQARDLADRAVADVIELRCELDAELADERIRVRMAVGTDASTATPTVAHQMASRFDPWPEATAVRTDGPVSDSVERALGACGWA